MSDKIYIENKESRFNEAAALVVFYNVGSTALLQRKLKMGYERACRIMRQLEQAGIVGEISSITTRKVLIQTEEQLNALLQKIK